MEALQVLECSTYPLPRFSQLCGLLIIHKYLQMLSSMLPTT